MALEGFAAEMDRCSSCSYCKWIPFDQVKAGVLPRIALALLIIISIAILPRSLSGGPFATLRAKRVQRYSAPDCIHLPDLWICDVSCKVCRYNLEPLEMVRELKFER